MIISIINLCIDISNYYETYSTRDEAQIISQLLFIVINGSMGIYIFLYSVALNTKV